MKRWSYLYPALFAAFPILFIYAQNADKMRLTDTVETLFIAVTAALILTVILNLFLRHVAKAALIVTVFIGLYFSFGHAVAALSGNFRTMDENTAGSATIVGVTWCLIFIFLTIMIIRSHRTFDALTRILASITLILVFVQIVQGGYTSMKGGHRKPREDGRRFQEGSIKTHPDIYFIVMDAFGRNDILRDLYGMDNSAFIDSLTRRGFYVADSSYSNYCETILSLTATLNLDYIHNLDNFDTSSHDYMKVAEYLWDNGVFRFLHERGYGIAAFETTGNSFTEAVKADVLLEVGGGLNEFEQILLSTTPWPYVFPADDHRPDPHGKRILSEIDKLAAIDEIASPKMVFAHVLSPHEPFVFASEEVAMDTASVEMMKRLGLAAGCNYKRDHLAGYGSQVRFISAYLIKTIDRLLARSADNPPIIIIQGDHGAKAGFDLSASSRTDLKEVFAILNAIYLPGISDSPLYGHISPVNNFRVIFNEYFGADFRLLPDRSYYTRRGTPYAFEAVKAERLVHPWIDLLSIEKLPFDSLSTLDRMLQYQLGLTGRPLSDCYTEGTPVLTFGKGRLELTDYRITRKAEGWFKFEGAFIARNLAIRKYEIKLKFVPPRQQGKSGSQEYPSFMFTGSLPIEQMTDGLPHHVEFDMELPFDPEKLTIFVNQVNRRSQKPLTCDRGGNQVLMVR